MIFSVLGKHVLSAFGSFNTRYGKPSISGLVKAAQEEVFDRLY
jgi:hypothetical protein